MTASSQRLRRLLVLYLLAIAFLCGAAAERFRFDGQRAALLSKYDDAVRRLRAQLIQVESGHTAQDGR